MGVSPGGEHEPPTTPVGGGDGMLQSHWAINPDDYDVWKDQW